MSRPIKALQDESAPPRQAHDVPHQTLALLCSSLPAFRGRWQAGSPHSARRRLLEAAGDRRAAVARLEPAAAVAPAQIRPAILTELAAMKAAGAPCRRDAAFSATPRRTIPAGVSIARHAAGDPRSEPTDFFSDPLAVSLNRVRRSIQNGSDFPGREPLAQQLHDLSLAVRERPVSLLCTGALAAGCLSQTVGKERLQPCEELLDALFAAHDGVPVGRQPKGPAASPIWRCNHDGPRIGVTRQKLFGDGQNGPTLPGEIKDDQVGPCRQAGFATVGTVFGLSDEPQARSEVKQTAEHLAKQTVKTDHGACHRPSNLWAAFVRLLSATLLCHRWCRLRVHLLYGRRGGNLTASDSGNRMRPQKMRAAPQLSVLHAVSTTLAAAGRSSCAGTMPAEASRWAKRLITRDRGGGPARMLRRPACSRPRARARCAYVRRQLRRCS